jgi:hypothetical protein
MRSFPVAFFLAIPLFLAACGGATDTLGSADDGGAHADSGADAGKSPDGGGTGPDGGVGIDSGVDCNALAASLTDLQAKAQACCATCDIVQCTASVQGLCCPVTVNSASAQTTLDFEAAVQQYHQDCPSECPAIACEKSPSGVCGAAGGSSSGGGSGSGSGAGSLGECE